jgi:hypothetical protein
MTNRPQRLVCLLRPALGQRQQRPYANYQTTSAQGGINTDFMIAGRDHASRQNRRLDDGGV